MDNKKYWFFGSKLNTVLLLILIILMVVALRWMYQDKDKYWSGMSKEARDWAHAENQAYENNKGIEKNSIYQNKESKSMKYENKELGFSFEYPKNLGELTFIGIGKGDKGETFGGGINFPQFYFAGNSRGYVAPEDGNFGRTNIENCGSTLSKSNSVEVKAFSKRTSNGEEYAFNIFSPIEGKQGFLGFDRGIAAYFTLKSTNKRFPCLGFSSIGENVLSDEEFLKIIDSVRIE